MFLESTAESFIWTTTWFPGQKHPSDLDSLWFLRARNNMKPKTENTMKCDWAVWPHYSSSSSSRKWRSGTSRCWKQRPERNQRPAQVLKRCWRRRRRSQVLQKWARGERRPEPWPRHSSKRLTPSSQRKWLTSFYYWNLAMWTLLATPGTPTCGQQDSQKSLR